MLTMGWRDLLEILTNHDLNTLLSKTAESGDRAVIIMEGEEALENLDTTKLKGTPDKISPTDPRVLSGRIKYFGEYLQDDVTHHFPQVDKYLMRLVSGSFDRKQIFEYLLFRRAKIAAALRIIGEYAKLHKADPALFQQVSKAWPVSVPIILQAKKELSDLLKRADQLIYEFLTNKRKSEKIAQLSPVVELANQMSQKFLDWGSPGKLGFQKVPE